MFFILFILFLNIIIIVLGIGFEVSKCLASRGCKIIIACRSKADNERRKLVELTHNENITIKHLDLTSFESVRNFAKEINKTEDKIDILINNAGIGAASGATVDGLNPVMQCNVFSPFLLTHLLAGEEILILCLGIQT